MNLDPKHMPRETNEDESHLHLLSVLHYVLAGLTALAGCLPLIYVAMGLIMIVAGTAANRAEAAAPAAVGVIILLIGLILFVVIEAFAISQFLNARYLQTYRHHTYCLVLAAIHCLSFPLGTLLGTFTIIVLVRPSVRRLFGVR